LWRSQSAESEIFLWLLDLNFLPRMSSSTWFFWGSSLGLKCTVGLMTYSSPYLAFYRKRQRGGGSRIVNRWDLAVLPLHTRPTSLRRFRRDPRAGPDEGEFCFFLTYVYTLAWAMR
jgi:hypothetical protein